MANRVLAMVGVDPPVSSPRTVGPVGDVFCPANLGKSLGRHPATKFGKLLESTLPADGVRLACTGHFEFLSLFLPISRFYA